MITHSTYEMTEVLVLQSTLYISIMANHLEILGTSYRVYTTSTRVKSGSFAKYGDCWNRDKNISPKIPRPFPVARTQIVEPVLLLNLKLYTVLVLT